MFHFFRTLITLIQAILFLMLGVMGVALPWSARLQEIVTQFLLERPIAVFLVGLGFLAVGAALLVTWRQSTKSHYYYVRSGRRSVAVDEKLVDSYLRTYWQDRFPDLDIESQASLVHHQLQILVHFPPIPKEQQKQILTQVQNELDELLTQYLGYHEPFRMTATFGEG